MAAVKAIIGIYKITSPTQKVYIGQSIDIIQRWVCHKSQTDKRMAKLYYSFKKHGFEKHIFEVIEECAIEVLNERERYWQDHYDVLSKKGLNLRLTQTKDRSGRLAKHICERISKANKNRVTSEQTRRKRSENMTGGGNSKARMIIDIYMGIYYDCGKDAGFAINVEKNTINRRINGTQYNNTNMRLVSKTKNEYIETINLAKINIIGENNVMAKLILNTETGVYYYGTREAAESSHYNSRNIFRKINGVKTLKQPFIYA